MRTLSGNAGRRAVLGLVVVSCAAVAFVPAHAAPSAVGQEHVDTATLVIRGSDGLSYRINVQLDAVDGQPPQGATLSVTYVGCKSNGKCGFTYSYGLTLASTSYSFPDKNSAVVTTTLVGKPVRLSWSGQSGGSNYEGDVGNDRVSFSDPTSGGTARVTAQLFGLSCNGNGTVKNYFGAFPPPSGARTTGPSRVPPAFVATKRAKPACQSG